MAEKNCRDCGNGYDNNDGGDGDDDNDGDGDGGDDDDGADDDYNDDALNPQPHNPTNPHQSRTPSSAKERVCIIFTYVKLMHAHTHCTILLMSIRHA